MPTCSSAIAAARASTSHFTAQREEARLRDLPVHRADERAPLEEAGDADADEEDDAPRPRAAAANARSESPNGAHGARAEHLEREGEPGGDDEPEGPARDQRRGLVVRARARARSSCPHSRARRSKPIRASATPQHRRGRRTPRRARRDDHDEHRDDARQIRGEHGAQPLDRLAEHFCTRSHMACLPHGLKRSGQRQRAMR